MFQYTKNDFINPKENIVIQKKTVDTDLCEQSHTHEFVELVYVLDGYSVQYVNGMEFKVQKGDMFFVDYNQAHSYKAKEYSYVDILIDPRIISNEFTDITTIMEIISFSIFNDFDRSEFNSTQCVHFSGEECCEVESIINNMILEFEHKQLGYVSMLSGYIRVLFSLFLRGLSKKEIKKGRNDEKYIKSILPEILEYINQHFNEKLSLNELAGKCFYNPTYFSHAFKKYCGKSLSCYIKEKRIYAVIDLLQTTDYSVETISCMVGYTDKSSFYRQFHEITGQLPADFRKSKKQK